MRIYNSVEEIPLDGTHCHHTVRRSVVAGIIDPTEEFCRKFSFDMAATCWRNSPKYQHFTDKIRRYRIRTWEEFDAGVGAEYLVKVQKFENKKEKIRQSRIKGGVGSQSPELKAVLANPISFKHTSGACVTVLPQRSAKDVADELSKISFCEYTNLTKILIRGSGNCKGWTVSPISEPRD
jgi:hypothetical protein